MLEHLTLNEHLLEERLLIHLREGTLAKVLRTLRHHLNFQCYRKTSCEREFIVLNVKQQKDSKQRQEDASFN